MSAIQEAAIRRIKGGDQPRQKVNETPSQPIKLGIVVYICHPRHMGSINRRIEVQPCPSKSVRPYWKK
jgi:hypothetical protein